MNFEIVGFGNTPLFLPRRNQKIMSLLASSNRRTKIIMTTLCLSGVFERIYRNKFGNYVVFVWYLSSDKCIKKLQISYL